MNMLKRREEQGKLAGMESKRDRVTVRQTRRPCAKSACSIFCTRESIFLSSATRRVFSRSNSAFIARRCSTSDDSAVPAAVWMSELGCIAGAPDGPDLSWKVRYRTIRWFFSQMSKLYRARSLLYRRQILQINIRWKALDEIYKIYNFTCLCTAQTSIFQKFFVKLLRIFLTKFAKIRYNIIFELLI